MPVDARDRRSGHSSCRRTSTQYAPTRAPTIWPCCGNSTRRPRPPQVIVHCWSVTPEPIAFDEAQRRGFWSLLHIARTWTDMPSLPRVVLTVVADGLNQCPRNRSRERGEGDAAGFGPRHTAGAGSDPDPQRRSRTIRSCRYPRRARGGVSRARNRSDDRLARWMPMDPGVSPRPAGR